LNSGPWNVKLLIEYVRNLDSEPTLSRINSIDRTIGVFIYHMSSARELIEKIEPSNEREQIELIFIPEESRLNLAEIKLGIQAEVQAAVHSARSIHDIFSQIANSLILETPMEVAKCDIKKLSLKLGESELKSHIDIMLGSESFIYIDSFVNTIKHRDLVKSQATLDLREQRSGIRFSSFEYRGKRFPALWAIQVLENALEVKNNIVKSGKLLNYELGISDV